MKFGTFLLAICEPLLAKILLSLGFSVVTITGVEVALGSLKSQLVDSMNALPFDLLNFALYIGVGKALGIVLGACATKLMLWSIQSATSIIGKNPT